jgi:rhodanese-related sulfurtransferase
VKLKTGFALFICLLALGLGQARWGSAAPPDVSGELVDGYRILTVPAGNDPLMFTVYRGDYIKFDAPTVSRDLQLVIPDLGLQKRMPPRAGQAAHITMRQAGVLHFTLDGRPGTLTVLEFRRPNYRELTAAQAADVIARQQPLILDVRTPREFESGHLQNAILIPVQVLRQHLDRLTSHRDREILVYCATGNRSTVASKILLDSGFRQIANLRHGIADWQQRRYPVVR